MILSVPYRPGKFVAGDHVTACGADLYVVKEVDTDGDEASVTCIKPAPEGMGRFTIEEGETFDESRFSFHRVRGGTEFTASFASAYHEPRLFPLDGDSEIELLRVRNRTGIDLRYLDWGENVGFDGAAPALSDGRFDVSKFWE